MADITVSQIVLLYQYPNQTPVELVPAPGAGKYYVPVNQVFQAIPAAYFDQYGTLTTYLGSDPLTWTLWSVNSGTSPSTDIFDSAQLEARADVAALFPNYYFEMSGGTTYIALPLAEDQPISLGSDTAWQSTIGDGVTQLILPPTDLTGNHDFAVGDTGTIDSGNGDATYIITAINGSGQATAATVTSPGTGYSTDFSDLSLIPGGGQPGSGGCDTAHIICAGPDPVVLRVTTVCLIADVLT